MKREVLHSVCALALLISACPRHSATRVTYVPPAPTPSTAMPAQTASGGTLVIEEPPPAPPPETVVVTPPSNPAPTERAPHRRRAEAPVAEKAPEPPPTPAPALEPLTNAQKQASLHSKVDKLQRDLPDRINRAIYGGGLKPGDRQALEDARGFLAQSLRALQDGDPERSLRLAQKASLLVDAVEQGR